MIKLSLEFFQSCVTYVLFSFELFFLLTGVFIQSIRGVKALVEQVKEARSQNFRYFCSFLPTIILIFNWISSNLLTSPIRPPIKLTEMLVRFKLLDDFAHPYSILAFLFLLSSLCLLLLLLCFFTMFLKTVLMMKLISTEIA